MPHILSGPIHVDLPGLWGEGAPYSTTIIYDIASGDFPPVHYQSHTLKPHSIPHIDAPGHIIENAETVEKLFQSERQKSFYGPVLVISLEGNNWKKIDDKNFLWEVSKEELQSKVKKLSGKEYPSDKLIITPKDCPLTKDGFHDSSYVFVLSEAAAKWLVSNPNFNALGTSWKSSDFKPGSRERPIHKILLKQAVLFEQLKLAGVPEGEYFFSAFPLYLKDATESPVTPVLFSKDELCQMK